MDPLILLIEPELDERAATATMSRAQRVYEQGARDISRVMREQLTEGAVQGGRAVEELGDKARRAYLSMGDAAEKVAREERKLDAAREKGASNTEALARRVERARLDEVQAINRARDAYNQYDQAAQNASRAGEQAGHGFLTGIRGAAAGVQSAGGEMAGGFAEGFAGSSALMRLAPALANPFTAAVVAVGAVGGKVLAENLMAGLENLQMQDQFRAKMGLDADTMHRYGADASRAWASGFGDSVQDNMVSLQFGIQSGLLDRNASDGELQNFTAQMDTMKRTMDADAREIAAGSRNYVKTGLVGSYQEAFDLLTAGQQKGLNISNDLLDTAEEYGTALHGVGLTGAESFGLIAQMQAGGIRNTDVAADSIKEFAINVADGSKPTAEAFAALGLNADQLNAKFSEGGPAARQAFGEVLTALNGLDDPIQKQRVGLALFKTKWEDAKTAIQAADIKTAASQMGDLDGKTKEATDALSAHTNQWDLLGRNVDVAMGKMQTWLADTSVGKFLTQGFPGFINDLVTDHPAQAPVTGPYNPANIPIAPTTPLNPLDILNPGAAAPAGPGGLLLPSLSGPLPPGGAFPSPTDRVPAVPMPDPAAAGGAGSKSLPDAPVLPLQYTNTAGLPSGIANATTRLDDARHEVAEKQARLNQLLQSNIADESDRQKARNDLAKADQDQLKAEQALTDARISATRQGTKQLGQLSSDMNDFGNKLDADFGISKGIGGIVENFVKAAGNILAAPFLQALGMIEKANPNEGSGLLGIGAANGMFGSQYTPAALAAQTQAMLPGYPAAPGMSPFASVQGMAQPGESNRDFAHRVMMPYWQNQGLTVGDHGADKYNEHQNGALDIMVKDLAQGQAVLQQVLQDPNVYGAIFNNQTYGYGHGLTPRDYTAGHTGNPTQDHQDHVHAWYKPGDPNDIASAGVPYMPGGPLSNGMPQAAPFGGPPAVSPASFGPPSPFAGQAGPGVAPGQAYPSHGGNSGNAIGGLALDGAMAATSALDMAMPGAGAAAKIGIQLANRTVGYAAQNAGIAASGIMETLSLGDNPRGGIGNSWLGKLAGGLAGAAPALPNLAGKKPPGPMDQASGGQNNNTSNVDNSQTHITLQPPKDTSASTQASMVTEQMRMRETPGRSGG